MMLSSLKILAKDNIDPTIRLVGHLWYLSILASIGDTQGYEEIGQKKPIILYEGPRWKTRSTQVCLKSTDKPSKRAMQHYIYEINALTPPRAACTRVAFPMSFPSRWGQYWTLHNYTTVCIGRPGSNFSFHAVFEENCPKIIGWHLNLWGLRPIVNPRSATGLSIITKKLWAQNI